MKMRCSVLYTSIVALAMMCSVPCVAAPYTVQITDVEMNNTGLYTDANGNPQAAIFVRGTFTPTLPCAQQGFFLLASDPLFAETIAIILTAKSSGTSLGYTHVYCYANGYSRGSTVSAE